MGSRPQVGMVNKNAELVCQVCNGNNFNIRNDLVTVK